MLQHGDGNGYAHHGKAVAVVRPCISGIAAVDLRLSLSLFRQPGFAASRQQKPEDLSLSSFPLKLQTALAPGGSHPKALWSQGCRIKPVTQVTKRTVRTFGQFI